MKHKLLTSLVLSTLLIGPSANFTTVTPTYQTGVILNELMDGVIETFPEGSFLVSEKDMTPVRKNKDGSLSRLTATKGVSRGLRFITDDNKHYSLIQGVLYDANKKVVIKGIKKYELAGDLRIYDQYSNMSILRAADGKLIQLKAIGLGGRSCKYVVKETAAGTYYVFTENSRNVVSSYIYKLGAKAAKKVELLNAPILDFQYASVSGRDTLLIHQKNQLTLLADPLKTYIYKVKARSYHWKMNEAQLIIEEAGKVTLVDLKTHGTSLLKGNYPAAPAPYYNGITGTIIANNKALILDAQENITATYDFETATQFPYSPTLVTEIKDQKTNETCYLWFGQITYEQYEGPLKTYLSCLRPNGVIQSIDLNSYLVYALGTQPTIADFDKLEDGVLYFKNDAAFPAFKVDATGAFAYLNPRDNAETLLLKKLGSLPIEKAFTQKDDKLINRYTGKEIPLKTYLNGKVTHRFSDNYIFVYTDWNNERTQDTMTVYDKLGRFVFTAETLESPYEAAELTPQQIYFVENETPYLYQVETNSRSQLDHLIVSSSKNYHYIPKISDQPRVTLDHFYYVAGPKADQIVNLSGKTLDTSADYYVTTDDTHFTYSKNNFWGVIAVDDKGVVTKLPADYQTIVFQPKINAYIAKNMLGLSVALTLDGKPLIPGAYDKIDIYDNCIITKSGSKTMLFQIAK